MSPKEQGNLTVEWFLDVIERCANVLVHEKSVSPTLFCLYHDGKMTYTKFGGISCDERKDTLLNAIRDIIRRTNPKGYVLAVEAFYLKTEEEDGLRGLLENKVLRVSQMPSKKECLMFTVGIGNKERYAQLQFSHDAKGEIELGDMHLLTNCDGRFTNLRSRPSPLFKQSPESH